MDSQAVFCHESRMSKEKIGGGIDLVGGALMALYPEYRTIAWIILIIGTSLIVYEPCKWLFTKKSVVKNPLMIWLLFAFFLIGTAVTGWLGYQQLHPNYLTTEDGRPLTLGAPDHIAEPSTQNGVLAVAVKKIDSLLSDDIQPIASRLAGFINNQNMSFQNDAQIDWARIEVTNVREDIMTYVVPYLYEYGRDKRYAPYKDKIALILGNNPVDFMSSVVNACDRFDGALLRLKDKAEEKESGENMKKVLFELNSLRLASSRFNKWLENARSEIGLYDVTRQTPQP